MALPIAFRVMNARTVSFAPLAFDLHIGVTDDAGKFVGLFIVSDFILKRKTDGTGYYYNGPSKLQTKGGEPVLKDGYKQYIEFFRPATEATADGSRMTKPAAEARLEIIRQAEAALQAISSGVQTTGPALGRGRPARKAAAPAPVGAKTAIDEDDVGTPTDSEEETDDLPF